MSFNEEGTLFGRIPEKNVYFLIDTSGSMYHQLGFVKEHLVEVLSNRAYILKDSMFNLIEFKDDIDKWADKLVHCTPTTVNLAARWINKLVCGTLTNTMGALLEAFGDSSSEAVYMVTDGPPDQKPTVILEKLKSLRQRTPVHSIYVSGVYSDSTTHDFLRDLAEQTEGSFHIVTLSHSGSVQKVIPVYNSKSSYLQRYGGNGCVFVDTKSYYDNVLVPRNTVYKNQTASCTYTGNSKILNYADAVIKARGLAQSAGVRCCSTPVACSLMKGIKVLARRDHDGLYYLGEVIQQGPSETFIVKFDSFPPMRKSIIQETSVQNMIAYKDAIRVCVSLGDNVLAPWKQHGCYGPGTVLADYIGKRDIQSGQKRGPVLVTLFNGETVELQPDIAVRISKETFDRVVRELQLPESQRRKPVFPERNNIPPTVDSQTEKTKWETGYGCPPAVLCTRAWTEERKTRKRINDQIKENSYILHALDLNNGLPDVLGKATASELRGYDSGVYSEYSSEASGDDSKMTYDDRFRIDFGIEDKEYDFDVSSSFPQPKATVLSKSAGNTETKKRWRYWNTGVPAKQPRFRETLLKKPREPGEKITNALRPGHEEYQTIAGISFPAGTDRKFDPKPQLWHPYRQFIGPPKENRSAVNQSSHLKHSEYQDASGVIFPSATDRKFKRIIDPNWRPETAMQNADRARNWEAGLGHGDMEQNAKYDDKLQKMRSNQGKYFKDIEDKVAVENEKEVKRIEFRRNKMTERQENVAGAVAEKNWLMTSRMNNRTERQAAIQKNEKQRTDNAEKWKHSRIKVRRDRLIEYTEIEGNLEREKEKRAAVREVRRCTRENERREEFHQKLRKEWQNEDERTEFLQRRHEINQEKGYKRQQDGERRKEARFAARQERLERYRASILL